MNDLIEVRRDSDGELCGFICAHADGWLALTVFGGRLGVHQDRATAVGNVLETGLASLADRWQLRRRGDAEAEIVCIQEASPAWVRVALGYYSLPGVPTRAITRAELDTGEWELFR